MEPSTKAGLPARGESPRDSSMIKTTESTGMRTSLAVWCCKPMLAAGKSSSGCTAVKSTGVIEVVAVREDSAVGYVVVVVEHDTVVMPVVSPVVPSPAEPAKEADSKAEAQRDPRTGKEQARIRIPAWPHPDGFSIHEPGVIFRHVNNLRVSRFDHNRFVLVGDLFLRRTI